MTAPLIRALRALYAIGPVLFGLGFLAPVLAELLPLAGWPAPLGLSPFEAGLVIGGAWGLYAQIRGSWI